MGVFEDVFVLKNLNMFIFGLGVVFRHNILFVDI